MATGMANTLREYAIFERSMLHWKALRPLSTLGILRARRGHGVEDDKPFSINLKGLWNVLEALAVARLGAWFKGSCLTVHPQGIFFDAHVRRRMVTLCGARLQEEMPTAHDALARQL